MLTTKQKCELRSLAQTIKPVFQIGKEGITGKYGKRYSCIFK